MYQTAKAVISQGLRQAMKPLVRVHIKLVEPVIRPFYGPAVFMAKIFHYCTIKPTAWFWEWFWERSEGKPTPVPLPEPLSETPVTRTSQRRDMDTSRCKWVQHDTRPLKELVLTPPVRQLRRAEKWTLRDASGCAKARIF